MSPVFGVISGACSTGRLGTVTTMVTGHVVTVSLLLGSWTYRGLEKGEAKKMAMSATGTNAHHRFSYGSRRRKASYGSKMDEN